LPSYEYVCESCGYEFERFQGITAKPARKCPNCGKRGLKRLIGTGAGIIFKGTGFYQTDYRSESYKAAVKSEKDTGQSKEKATVQKSEDKKPRDKHVAARKDGKKSA
jgi:putative FmdB family regulatory protein